MTTVVGRERELQAVETFLAGDRRSDALTLVGEPGIGKTTIWQAGLRRAREHGWQVLAARPGEQETRLRSAVLADLFQPPLPDDARAVLERLGEMVREQPTLVAIDDLQWADEVSETALRFAVRRLAGERLAVLVTLRTAVPKPLGAEQVEAVPVGPLDEDELDAIVREHGVRALLRPALRYIHRVSGGNPFFALELARALEREPAAAGPPRVPTTLRALVGSRVDGLPDAVRPALVAVAAARQPTPAAVEATVGPGAGAAIGVALEQRLLELDGGRLRFAHPLLQSIVYEDAPAGLRERVHQRLAVQACDPEERAAHLAAAARLPDERVAHELEEVGTHAAADGRPVTAAWLLEESVRLTAAESRADLTRRTLAAADACRELGDAGRARRLLHGVLDLVAGGPDRARALRRLAGLQAHDLGFGSTSGLLREALECAEGDVALVAAIERDLATTISQFGSLDEAAAHARRAVELAAAIGDVAGEREVRTQLHAIELLRGHGEPAGLGQLVAARPPASSESGFLVEHMMLASMLKWIDRLEPARKAFEDIRDAIRDRDAEGMMAPIAFHLAELECWAGNLDDAERLAHESRDAALRSRQRSSDALGRYVIALVAAWRGEAEVARAEAAAGLALAEQAADVRLIVRNLKVLGLAELGLGAFEAAAAPLARAHRTARDSGCREPGCYRLEPDLIEALVAAGRHDDAEATLEQLREPAERLRRPWALAALERSRALVLSGHGAAEEAATAAAQAARLSAALDQPLELARALLVEGTLHRRARRKRLAAEALDEAEAIFAARGARPWAERSRAERSRIGGRAPAPGGLTPTERQVADLVAAGRANKEVAAQLHLSVKTVEANLSRIYRKLGVRSRSQLAARLVRGDP